MGRGPRGCSFRFSAYPPEKRVPPKNKNKSEQLTNLKKGPSPPKKKKKKNNIYLSGSSCGPLVGRRSLPDRPSPAKLQAQDHTAIAGYDYEEAAGTLSFEHTVQTATIEIVIKPKGFGAVVDHSKFLQPHVILWEFSFYMNKMVTRESPSYMEKMVTRGSPYEENGLEALSVVTQWSFPTALLRSRGWALGFGLGLGSRGRVSPGVTTFSRSKPWLRSSWQGAGFPGSMWSARFRALESESRKNAAASLVGPKGLRFISSPPICGCNWWLGI